MVAVIARTGFGDLQRAERLFEYIDPDFVRRMMTTKKKFHLGWFTNFTANLWNGPFENGGSPWTGDFYVEMAQAIERACFDFIMVEDKLSVFEAYGGSTEMVLKNAVGSVPKHESTAFVEQTLALLSAITGAARTFRESLLEF